MNARPQRLSSISRVSIERRQLHHTRMSNAIKSYEGILGIIKKYWHGNLCLYYVPAQYDPIILNIIGELLSMKKFKFVRSLEVLLEPIELIKTNRTVVVVMSAPLLNHYFNQPLVLQDDPVEFIHNSNPLKTITAVSIEETARRTHPKQIDQLFIQHASPRQRQISIQMMRIVLLAVHVQQHYLEKHDQDTPDHRGFHTLEVAVREKKTEMFYADSDYDDDDDNDDCVTGNFYDD